MPEIITRAEAKARGLTRYFTGIPCARGHIAERYANWGTGTCVDCHRQNKRLQFRQQMADDPDFRKKYNKRKNNRKRVTGIKAKQQRRRKIKINSIYQMLTPPRPEAKYPEAKRKNVLERRRRSYDRLRQWKKENRYKVREQKRRKKKRELQVYQIFQEMENEVTT